MALTKTQKIALVILTIGAMGLSGCELIEQIGSSDQPSGGVVTTPPDYNVSTDPEEPTTPGDNGTQPTDPEPEVDIVEGFVINGGSARTNQAELTLEFVTLNRNGMKISFDHNCASGSWEPYAHSKVVTSPLLNQQVPVSVQFRDWDNRAGNCFRQSIIHDGKGPNIIFTKYPLSILEEGSLAQVIFEVTDALGTVQGATCSLNGLEKPCFAGRNEVSITQLPVGDYTFAVRATDNLGNESQASVSWSVVSLSRNISQNIRVNNYKKVDILFVIDNSGSMEYEQKNMAQRTANFIQVLRGLDYQIGITTTDPRNINEGDGRFLPLKGYSGKYIIDSSFTEAQAQDALSKTLQRSETGSGSEQGIRAAYRSVDRYNSNESRSRAFFRDGAQFAVVLISDEDESDNTNKNDPENLIAHVGSSFNGQKMFSFHSIITRPGDTACRQTHGYAYGDRYKVMSELTGGVIGSVCEQDYAAQVTGIAQGVRDLLKTLTLQCKPLENRPIVIKRDGVVVTPAYTMDGVNMKFASELDPGEYNVDYHCLR
ncbi:MAG: VWA domain-containing protein [Bdellovibrionaceae bacterium]|nr:VWA domain-containing protein [Pseudobdellovibrionaceae bacterium]